VGRGVCGAPGDGVEAGRQGFDLATVDPDPAVELLDQLGGPAEPLGQAIDVDLTLVELGDDGIELGRGLGIGEVRRGAGCWARAAL